MALNQEVPDSRPDVERVSRRLAGIVEADALHRAIGTKTFSNPTIVLRGLVSRSVFVRHLRGHFLMCFLDGWSDSIG
eukprot:1171929-Amphidinium_carterae.1